MPNAQRALPSETPLDMPRQSFMHHGASPAGA